MTIRPISYDAYRKCAQQGDVLVCAAASLEGHVIKEVTHMRYSHASMVGFINPHRRDDPRASALMIAESVQRKDTRVITLSREIERYTGLYSVFRVKEKFPRLAYSGFDGDAAWSWMCRAAETPYSWHGLARVACRRHMPWPMNRIAATPNSDDPRKERFCSERVQAALRIHGGPVIRVNDCDCEPGDLTDPRSMEYLYTIYATIEQAADAAGMIAARRALAAADADARENGVESEGDDAA